MEFFGGSFETAGNGMERASFDEVRAAGCNLPAGKGPLAFVCMLNKAG